MLVAFKKEEIHLVQEVNEIYKKKRRGRRRRGGKEMIDLNYIIDWTEAPGAFPSGGYQDVRDADSAEFA